MARCLKPARGPRGGRIIPVPAGREINERFRPMPLPDPILGADADALPRNYFATPGTAARYAAHRPRSHGHVLAILAETMRDALPVTRALDIGCGTGHSTQALLPYARSVVGVEPLTEMLAQATLHPRIEYRRGYAEALPSRSGEFDLVTVSSAYHWFDQAAFLAEAARVLRTPGWLVLYKVGSMGRLPHCPEFDTWRRHVLRARYPKTEKHAQKLPTGEAESYGFVEVRCEIVPHQQTYTRDGYVENLLTHSRFIRAAGAASESITEVRAWLHHELAPFFPGGTADFTHETWIHVWHRG